ncbi:hypothetical protein RS130_15945 [Paraglaciecola aquimarina]|uniref:Uncharacterized protein n=1 Tax=Paraglaciecola aquimarina TaxID=1235557 RepID=A0ABU3SYW7_9ALTE|nr:hypothetical protein [Paraglaciecola aquimarina]MDU0355190.1 hypothetical protein [Paraglaciecola aquimarina]
MTSTIKAKRSANAEKQKRFREKQKQNGKKQVRGYVTPEAMQCYREISDKTNWTDSEILSNALRITYAAYKCGQIKLLNEWLKDNEK